MRREISAFNSPLIIATRYQQYTIMGLDYDYKVYPKREKLLVALKYLQANCDEKRSGFEINNGRLIRVNRFHNRIEKND